MKTWPHTSPSPFFKILAGGWLLTTPLFLAAQTSPIAAPLQTPASTDYPGVYESFEKLIQVDETRLGAKARGLQGAERNLTDLADVEKLDLDPDFMNSLILNSPSGYLRLAGQSKCAFYDVLLADLLRTKDGRIETVFIQYQDKAGGNVSATARKQDFLQNVVYRACPKTRELVSMFQVRALDATIKATDFGMPQGRPQCEALFASWSADPRTPYWCQVHEVMKEGAHLEATGTAVPGGDQRVAAANQRKVAMAKILRGKLSDDQRDFLENFCQHADDPRPFCDSFLTSSYFAKIADGSRPDHHVRQLCRQVMSTAGWTPAIRRECVRKLRADPDSCQWTIHPQAGLSPRPRCDLLSTALNASNLRADYEDCPRLSDQQAVTNLARMFLHAEATPVPDVGRWCSSVSAATFLDYNRRADNEGAWNAGLCYTDRVEEREKCLPVFFGDHPTSPAAAPRVVAEVLSRTKGATPNTKCTLVGTDEWNPTLLQYRYGCFIVMDPENCGISSCGHKVYWNDLEVKDLRFRPVLAFDYFPTSVQGEKYSMTYLIQRDATKKTQALQTLPAVTEFFRQNPRGIIHGIGCAEDLLPGFFRKTTFNQCSPLPFIVDGIVRDGGKAVLVTRSAADDLHAPRLIPWARLFAAVKGYQFHQPLRQWSMHALY